MTLTPIKKAEMLEVLQKAISIVTNLPEATPCKSCDHWDKGQCAKFGAVPPADVQETGCPEWVDGIPF